MYRFGFEDRISVLIAPVSGHCLLFPFIFTLPIIYFLNIFIVICDF